jgi:ATP-dependent RNA helicase RhlE
MKEELETEITTTEITTTESNPFEALGLHPLLVEALRSEGYVEPTPIQKQAIPKLLAGRDLLATAETGTGKTAAFALPTLQLLPEGKQALVLTPTRELALQIDESFRVYGARFPLRTAVILGGVSQQPQVDAIRKRPDIVVATPGRLLDLMRQKVIRLDQVQILILDEADRMLDMGFIEDVRKIVRRVPKPRQTMFFSATLSNEVLSLASDMLDDPEEVAVSPPATVAGAIEQRVMFVSRAEKRLLLTELLQDPEAERVLVFAATKDEADRIQQHLSDAGISADAIHSNKNQKSRQKALAAFATGKVRVLVATDIMARGIDVENISHVINYHLPFSPENYVHRIGRTARAGSPGIAVSLCDVAEVPLLNDIVRLTKTPMTVDDSHSYHSAAIATLHFGQGKKPKNSRSGWRSFRPRARARG